MSLPLIILILKIVLGVAALAVSGWLGVRLFYYVKNRPRHYFVRWLTDKQKASLAQAAIPFATQSAPDGESGIVVRRRHFKRALKVLAARLAVSLPLAGQDKMHEAVIYSAPARKNPCTARFTPSSTCKILTERRLLAVARDVLAGHLDGDIVVHSGTGHVLKPPKDGNIHIFTWSSPAGRQRYAGPTRVFGIPLAESANACQSSGAGIPLIDEATRYPVGEQVGKCFYVHFNLLASSPDVQVAAFTRILQRFLSDCNPEKFVPAIVQQVLGQDDVESISDCQGHTEGLDDQVSQVITPLTRAILGSRIGESFLIAECNGKNQRPTREGMFRIFLNSSPLGTPCLPTPPELWSMPLLADSSAFVPSGLGVPVVDDGGFIVAELVGGNLYVHAGLVHYGSRYEALLFARLLKAVRDLWKGRGETGNDLDTSGIRLQDECWRQVTAVTAAIGDSQELRAEARAAQQQLATALKSTRQREQELYQLERSPSADLEREFDELCNTAKIIKAEVSSDGILLFTDVLYCRDPRTGLTHEIGEFKIWIPADPSQRLQWLNQTRTVYANEQHMHAPHVGKNGYACLGNTEDLFPMLIRQREFATAAQLAIAFIESVDVADKWGACINRWPVVHGTATAAVEEMAK